MASTVFHKYVEAHGGMSSEETNRESLENDTNSSTSKLAGFVQQTMLLYIMLLLFYIFF